MNHEEMRAQIAQIEREAAGGGGFIGLIDYSFGYKVFAEGFKNEQTWFPSDLSEASKREAIGKARTFIKEHSVLDNQGRAARPQVSICFHVPLTSLKLGGDNWNVDQYFITPVYYDAYKMTLKPAIDELDIWPGQFWARFAWTAEPTGRTRVNQEGETVAQLVAYPIEVFANEAEAEGAAGAVGEQSATTAAEPPLWLVDEVRRWAGELSKDLAPLALAKSLGVEPEVASMLKAADEPSRVKIMAEAFDQSEEMVKAALG